MKSYKCEKLGSTLNFLPDKVNFCCSYSEGPNIEYKTKSEFSFKKIIKAKKKCIKQLKYGEIPLKCQGCIEYKEKKIKNFFDFLFLKNDFSLVKEIIVNHYKQCDCKCLYCSQKYYTDKGVTQNYELLPIIKELYKNNSIDKDNLIVEFQGGNVSVLNEFELLVSEFLKEGCKRFSIKTNGIKYLPIIEEISKKRVIVDIQISLDCGTKETFKKIKGVDAFEQVISNIKEFSIKTSAIINLKYILIKGINDNINEFLQFFELVKELRCVNSVCIDIDYRDIVLNKGNNFKVPLNYYDLVNRAADFFQENRIDFLVSPYAKQYMDNNKAEVN